MRSTAYSSQPNLEIVQNGLKSKNYRAKTQLKFNFTYIEVFGGQLRPFFGEVLKSRQEIYKDFSVNTEHLINNFSLTYFSI